MTVLEETNFYGYEICIYLYFSLDGWNMIIVSVLFVSTHSETCIFIELLMLTSNESIAAYFRYLQRIEYLWTK